MSSLNRAMIIGRVGQDPTEHPSKNGTSVAFFSVATSDSWTDRETGDKKEATEWHNVVAYNKLADIVLKYVKKGTLLYVDGKLRKEDYVSKDGIPKLSVKIIANTVQMLGSKQSSSDSPAKPVDDPELNDDVPF